jgi:hypothetical protein
MSHLTQTVCYAVVLSYRCYFVQKFGCFYFMRFY